MLNFFSLFERIQICNLVLYSPSISQHLMCLLFNNIFPLSYFHYIGSRLKVNIAITSKTFLSDPYVKFIIRLIIAKKHHIEKNVVGREKKSTAT